MKPLITLRHYPNVVELHHRRHGLQASIWINAGLSDHLLPTRADVRRARRVAKAVKGVLERMEADDDRKIKVQAINSKETSPCK